MDLSSWGSIATIISTFIGIVALVVGYKTMKYTKKDKEEFREMTEEEIDEICK